MKLSGKSKLYKCGPLKQPIKGNIGDISMIAWYDHETVFADQGKRSGFDKHHRTQSYFQTGETT
jgi:hypothetical protein